MPIPKPKEGESKKDFTARCMSNSAMLKEFPDKSQRAAVCAGSFKTNDSKVETPLTNASFKVNLDGNMTWRVLEGKKYLVGPVVMITEGVHNNVYYPADELAKFPQAWNGRHVPVYHPEDLVGNSVSANSPETIEKCSVGFIFNTTFSDGKLKAELWVDPEKANAIDEDVMNMLINNVMLEVSTGLFVEEIKAPGVWNDEPYSTIAVNYRPDHLALLPKETGACSIEDGAGFPRVNASSKKLYKKFQEFERLMNNKDMSFDDIRQNLWTTLKTEYKDAWIYINDVFSGYIIYEVEPEEMSETDLIKLYRRSYIIEETGSVVLGDAVEVQRVVQYEEVLPEQAKQIVNTLKTNINTVTRTNQGDHPMNGKVEALITNGQTHWTEEDRSYLESLEEGVLDKMIPVEKVVEPVAKTNEADTTIEDAVPAAPEAASNELTLDAIDQLIERKLNANKAQPIVERLAANEKCPFDAEELAQFPIAKLEKLEESLVSNKGGRAPSFIGQGGSPAPQTNAGETVPEMPQLFAKNTEDK